LGYVVVIGLLLLWLAPAIFAARKKLWQPIGIWFSGSCLIVLFAFLLPITWPVMFVTLMWLDYWLWRLAEKTNVK
jgi:hypothetical protein